MYSAGTAYLTVVPSFKGIEKAFEAEAAKIGRMVEDAVGRGMRNAAGQAGQHGGKAGDEYGGAFAEAMKKHLDAAQKAVGKITVDADTKPFERAMAKAREELALLRDAKIGVDLNEGEFFAEVERIQREVHSLDHEHASIELRTNASRVLAELRAVQALKRSVEGGGISAPDASRPASASSSVGGAHVDTSEATAKISALNGMLDALNKRKIRIPADVDISKAVAGFQRLKAAVEAFGSTKKISIELNAGKAIVDAAGLRTTLMELGRMVVRVGVKVDTTAALGNLKVLNSQINSVSKNTVAINVKANTTASIAALTALDKLVDKVDGKTINIDVNLRGAASAMAALVALNVMVNRLQRQNIRLGIGSAGAAAAAAGAGAAASAMSGLGQAADFSLGRLGALVAVGASLGTAIVPAAAAAAASISAIATAATAAVAGAGVFVLGIMGVIKAVGALDKAEKDQAKADKSYGQSQGQIQNALDGVRDAHENLGRTRDEVARGAKRAARAVVDAHQQVIDAEKEALQAERDLMRAKQEAQRQDEDRAFSLRDNALAQRQATLDIADAKKELDKVLNNPRSTQAEREEAKITYEERLLQMDRLKTEGQRLEEDKARVAKEGADVVVAAQDRVVASQKNVAKAQQGLADAIEAQTQQQVDGQRQLIDSQQAVIKSQRALEQAYVSSATAGGAAMQNLKTAMDALSPAGRKFALFLFGLKNDFKEIQHAAEAGMLPGLQQAIQKLVPFFPAIRNFVFNVAQALGDTFIMIADTLRDPVWVQWFSYIGNTAGPTLKGMAEFAMNVATGLVGLFNALSGFNAPIGGGLLQWSEMFRAWGSNLGTNKGFQAFIAYVRESAPKVLELLRQTWVTITHIVEAAAPIGSVVVAVFAKLFEWINKIPTDVLLILVATISGVALAFLVFAGIVALVTSPIALIILGIGALVAAFAILYVKVKPFREFIDASLRLIADAAIWLWKNAIKPAVDGIVWLWQNVLAPVAVWLWKNVIKPAFDGIAAVISFCWTYIVKPIFTAMMWLIQNVIGPLFGWLYQHVVKPAFDGIAIGAKIMWAIIEVIFGLIVIALKIVGGAVMLFWKYAMKPAWDAICAIIEGAWNTKIKPIIELFAAIFDRYLKPAFQAGVEILGRIWDGIVEVTKVPIRFVVDTVLNDGILAAYNWIAKKFNVKPDDVHITLPSSFYSATSTWKQPAAAAGKGQSRGAPLRDGGYITGPGGPRDDLINARLSNGEYVIPADIVSSLGVEYFDHLTDQEKRGPQRQHLYADGGLVGFLKSGWNAITDPVAWLKEQAEKLFAAIPGGQWVKDQLTGVGKNIVGGITKAVSTMFASSAASGGDASIGGIAGDAAVSFPPWPASPGSSRGDSGVWRNIVALIKSTGPMSGSFGNAYRPGDPLWHGSGHAVDWMGYNQDGLASFLMQHRPLELIHRTPKRDYAFTRGVDKGSFHEQLMQEHLNHVHIAMDTGGWLMPGMSGIWNGTGRPEAVLTGQQWNTLDRVINSSSTPASNVYNFANTTLDESQFRAHDDRVAAQARIGRPR